MSRAMGPHHPAAARAQRLRLAQLDNRRTRQAALIAYDP
jgi:hypothetical protein